MEIIKQYFQGLTDEQLDQLGQLSELYAYWNERINVISRKDIENLYEKHVLHSLGIATVLDFNPGAHILDVGTGGGFPGIPLAILYPKTQFHLIDSINKKILVVQKVASALGLKNVTAQQLRAENAPKQQYDFVVSRAVAQLTTFYPWIHNKLKKTSEHELKNGLLALKGGDLRQEVIESELKGVTEFALSEQFDLPFFETKKVIYVPKQ